MRCASQLRDDLWAGGVMPVRKCGTFANRFFLLKLKVRLEVWRQRWQIAATLDSRGVSLGWELTLR